MDGGGRLGSGRSTSLSPGCDLVVLEVLRQTGEAGGVGGFGHAGQCPLPEPVPSDGVRCAIRVRRRLSRDAPWGSLRGASGLR